METISKHVLIAITELAIIKNNKEFTIPWEGLRLRSTLRENDDSLLSEALNYLRDTSGAISTWELKNKYITVSLSKNQNIPKTTQNDKEKIFNLAVRRALIYRLYEEVRKRDDRLDAYALTKLIDILEVSKGDISRNADHLIEEYYIEYAYMDGGMYTCNITHEGIKLCEDKSELFEEFRTIDINIVNYTEDEIEMSSNQKKVFVVHGRNERARLAMFSFLRAVGLEPIEWSKAKSYTREGTPSIGTILKHAFKEARAVIVLITGEDIAKLHPQLLQDKDKEYEINLTPQARPNVLFEAGMAFGSHPKQTIIVELGNNRPFSDISGLHIINLNNDATTRQELVSCLDTAGCLVDTNNKTEWLNEGNFEGALLTPDETLKKDKPILKSHPIKKEPGVLNELESKILESIAALKDIGLTDFDIYSIINTTEVMISEIKLKYLLTQLENNNYLYTSRSAGKTKYYLKQEGRAYLVENDLV